MSLSDVRDMTFIERESYLKHLRVEKEREKEELDNMKRRKTK